MTRAELLLTILAEECNETAQRASKAIRFTLDEIEPNDKETLTNAERIVYEFNDILAVMVMLHEDGLLDKVIDWDAVNLKKLRVEKWIEYSKTLGTTK